MTTLPLNDISKIPKTPEGKALLLTSLTISNEILCIAYDRNVYTSHRRLSPYLTQLNCPVLY